ncbi:MAG: stage 0 sporulation family protein [Lachnospiraceae bacterium]
MIKVVGVRFRTAGKIYYFDPLSFEINKGEHVIVETARGIEYGSVVGGVKQVPDDQVIQPLKPVLRVATKRDSEQEATNKQKEKDAFKVCAEKIREHELEMKLVDVEYTFDNNKVLFYFTADGRIDFRDLVKDLASIFKTRIELRQIGVRDETKIVGGIGVCGRPLCCHTHLSDFIPVSIKMAKDQNLSLNPTKISGVCSRLMCCLKHEEDTYVELNKKLPHVGDHITCPNGMKGDVVHVNILRQQVKALVDNGGTKEMQEFKVEDITVLQKGNKNNKPQLSKEELKELDKLERIEKAEKGEKAENSPKQNKRDKNFKDSQRKDHQQQQQKNQQQKDKNAKSQPAKGDKQQPSNSNNNNNNKSNNNKNNNSKNNNNNQQQNQNNKQQQKKIQSTQNTDQKIEQQTQQQTQQQTERKAKKPYYRNRNKNNKGEGKSNSNEN